MAVKRQTETPSGLPADVPQYVYDHSYWKLRNKKTYTTKEIRKVTPPPPPQNNNNNSAAGVWIYSVAKQCIFTIPLSFPSNLGKRSLLQTKIRDSTGCNNRIFHEFKTDPSTKIIWNLPLLQENKMVTMCNVWFLQLTNISICLLSDPPWRNDYISQGEGGRAVKKIYCDHRQENISKFKCTILIGSRLGVYSCLIFRKKQKGKRVRRKRKVIFHVKASFFRNASHYTTTKYPKVILWDHSGQCPVQYLENIGPSMEQSDWFALVIGSLN